MSAVGDARVDIAAFYWLALDAKLVSTEVVIAWADGLIAAAVGAPDVPLIDLSLAAGRPID